MISWIKSTQMYTPQKGNLEVSFNGTLLSFMLRIQMFTDWSCTALVHNRTCCGKYRWLSISVTLLSRDCTIRTILGDFAYISYLYLFIYLWGHPVDKVNKIRIEKYIFLMRKRNYWWRMKMKEKINYNPTKHVRYWSC